MLLVIVFGKCLLFLVECVLCSSSVVLQSTGRSEQSAGRGLRHICVGVHFKTMFFVCFNYCVYGVSVLPVAFLFDTTAPVIPTLLYNFCHNVPHLS